MDRSQPVSPVLERRCRSDRPGTCSTNVLREQLFRSQKYRRTRSRTMTRRKPNGLSSRARWYLVCTRFACFRQSGHRPGRAMDTASTTRTSEESLTRSTRTSIPGNSTASTVLLAMAGNTLPKRSPVPLAHLGIHGTADRAELRYGSIRVNGGVTSSSGSVRSMTCCGMRSAANWTSCARRPDRCGPGDRWRSAEAHGRRLSGTLSVTRLVIVGWAASWAASRATIVPGWLKEDSSGRPSAPRGRRFRGPSAAGRAEGLGVSAEASCSSFLAGPVALSFRLATAFPRAVDLAEWRFAVKMPSQTGQVWAARPAGARRWAPLLQRGEP